jgi:hypothetical protein
MYSRDREKSAVTCQPGQKSRDWTAGTRQ